ncbi:MAG: fatty-acid synthase [Acidobacteria bacterium]|nr:fatty-acid synthase [Acidobacteriota bacterium]
MAAKDLYHEQVKAALGKDGWTITADPLALDWDNRDVQIDLAAEKLLLAEKDARRIAIEVKSFLSSSLLQDLYAALDQFLLYRKALQNTEPERELFLAVREAVWQSLLNRTDSAALLHDYQVKLLIFDEQEEAITQWIS